MGEKKGVLYMYAHMFVYVKVNYHEEKEPTLKTAHNYVVSNFISTQV